MSKKSTKMKPIVGVRDSDGYVWADEEWGTWVGTRYVAVRLTTPTAMWAATTVPSLQSAIVEGASLRVDGALAPNLGGVLESFQHAKMQPVRLTCAVRTARYGQTQKLLPARAFHIGDSVGYVSDALLHLILPYVASPRHTVVAEDARSPLWFVAPDGALGAVITPVVVPEESEDWL